MTPRRPGFFAKLGLRVSVLALSLGTLAFAGCADEDQMPDGIMSLAVLPVDVTPFYPGTSLEAGATITGALANGTRFRIVGADSVRRVLSGPEGEEQLQRLNDQARLGGGVSPALAGLLADRLHVGGLVLSEVEIRMNSDVDGRVALRMNVYDRTTGERVWGDRHERRFVSGDAGFNQAIGALASELVAEMPKPAGSQ